MPIWRTYLVVEKGTEEKVDIFTRHPSSDSEPRKGGGEDDSVVTLCEEGEKEGKGGKYQPRQFHRLLLAH